MPRVEARGFQEFERVEDLREHYRALHARTRPAPVSDRFGFVKPPRPKPAQVLPPAPKPRRRRASWLLPTVRELPPVRPKIIPAGLQRSRIIRNICCIEAGISVEEFMSERRVYPIPQTRQLAAYIVHRLLGYGLAETGRRLGRDHTTILHAVRRVESRRLHEPDFNCQVVRVMSSCAAALMKDGERGNGNESERPGTGA